MSMNFVDNLLFQKKEFPEIYESYSTISDYTVSMEFNCKKNLKFLCIQVDGELDLLNLVEEVFHTSFVCDRGCDTYIIRYGMIERIEEVKDEVGMMMIEINHPFLKRNFSVLICKSITDTILQKTSVFITYKKTKLKQLQELNIRKYFNYDYEQDNLKSIDELKKFIMEYEPEYKVSISKDSFKEKIQFEGAISTDKLSLDMIKLINEKWDEKEDLIVSKCIELAISSFELCARAILSYNLQNGAFEDNFVCVEKYFVFMKKVKKKISDYFDKKIILSLQEYRKKKMDYVVLHNLLSSDKGILDLDDYIEEEMEQFKKLLEV